VRHALAPADLERVESEFPTLRARNVGLLGGFRRRPEMAAPVLIRTR
jgi:hypothetical protein